jgi:hypothetical protein
VIRIYLLPILIAPKGPDTAVLEAASQSALYKGTFRKDLKGSDFLHWGEGEVSVSSKQVSHMGKLAPGPDYKLYLVKGFVEDEAQFEAVRAQAARIGDVKTFNGFVLACQAASTLTTTTPPSCGVRRFPSSYRQQSTASWLVSQQRHCLSRRYQTRHSH